MARDRSEEIALTAGAKGARKKKVAALPTSAQPPSGNPQSAVSQGAQAQAAGPQLPNSSGRVVIEAITPAIDAGGAPVKRVVGDWVTVEADIFTDGHELIAATALYRREGEPDWRSAPMRLLVNDRWTGRFKVEENARYEYAVEAWRDPFASWSSDVRKKVAAASNDVGLSAIEGANLVKDAIKHNESLAPLGRDIAKAEGDTSKMLDLLLSDQSQKAMADGGLREDVNRSAVYSLSVDRLRARFSAWYEVFPRSMSPTPNKHGGFKDVIAILPYVRDLGFDVLYFPPIHPIGTTNRKGRNNALKAGPSDVGSVYAIGSPEGGHDAVHPELGTLDDFRGLVAAARAQGLEIALDFAVQCSPDHPWIKEHPEWFLHRPDGSIKYAENPPKKYEDIVNINFGGPGYPSVWLALRDVVLFWLDQGVRIFRVDNPHTKPLPFWRWLIAEVAGRDPGAIFLAEAFTKPKMMKALAKAGFQQSYTYFTWRNAKWELSTYLTELAGDWGECYRPNFFVTTPDINPIYLQTSGPAGFMARATLAATLSSNWGVYSGYEFGESAALPGREEYLDSEKYELKRRDFGTVTPIAAHLRRLNNIRRDNPALQDFRNILFTNAWNDQILAFAKTTTDRSNFIFVIVNLDPHHAQQTTYELPLWEFGLPDDASIEVEDLLHGNRFTMYGKTHTIALDPAERSAVVWRLIGPHREGAAG